MPVLLALAASLFAIDPPKRLLDIHPKPIATDPTVKYDYDIVYVRAPRYGDQRQIVWSEVFDPIRAEPRADLMLLHPNGSEEVLVDAGDDSITDPYVSFDGQWVFYARFHNLKTPGSDKLLSQSADILKIHVKSRKIVQLTHQEFTPNTGVADPNRRPPGIFNLGPCPLPGGKLMFTSTRNGFISSKDYEAFAVLKDVRSYSTLQLFSMDDDGRNVELIGHQNLNSALHPTILKDGRVMFSTYESEGLRDLRTWAIWTIHPDGTNWFPLVSALGGSGATARHFMTQLSDGTIVAEEYYFQRSLGFGTFFSVSPSLPGGQPYFGSASKVDTRNYAIENYQRVPFTPHGMQELTRFSHFGSDPSYPSDPKDPKSPGAGKVTLPSGAPDDHLLLVWSPGPVSGITENDDERRRFHPPAIDSGIYLLKSGKPIDEPGKLLLIKNDPNYNEQWPRALVPYKRIYGVDEPVKLPHYEDDGKLSKHLPEGTPYGMVGSSSLYKRESYPGGSIYKNEVTAWAPEGDDPFRNLGTLGFYGFIGNWFNQGAETSKYDNSEIHAIRILVTEPTTDPTLTGTALRRWWNAGNERLRILGEIPVRKFQGGKQPLDPDGNPDTSFLVKVPADVAWTFQTLDKDGMVLNMSQTWHQVRPGEIRANCGGCHAHSQMSTAFEKTAAAHPNYSIFDLTKSTPLVTTKQNDQSGKKWDEGGQTGLRFEKSALNVEFYHDVKPILDRSCVACHTQSWDKPAGDLVLDDNSLVQPTESEIVLLFHNPRDKVSGTFMRLAADQVAKYGYAPGIKSWTHPSGWTHPQGSRYVRYFQARRSLLAWKIYGRRLDGFQNEDFAYETVPGDVTSLVYKGQHIPVKGNERKINIAYLGGPMPPPEAVAGNYRGPDGKPIQVAPLTDEDRKMIVRWIDLGCPIDLDFDPAKPPTAHHGWFEDDQRPTLALTYPRAGVNAEFSRILVGMHDYESGLDLDSFRVVADFPLNGIAAGQNLAPLFKPKTPGVWELKMSTPLTRLAQGRLTVSINDKQGNATRSERTFSVRKQ